MQTQQQFQILVANESHFDFAQIICDEMAASAAARGTGIAKRSPDYIKEKMREGKAVIAFNQDGIWAGMEKSRRYSEQKPNACVQRGLQVRLIWSGFLTSSNKMSF